MGILRAIANILADGAYNRRLYKSGLANRNEIRETTIGWRPDPWNKEDGMTPDEGNDCIVGFDEVTNQPIYATPSGNKEYYRIVRKKGR